jgi:hypothetical protein
MQSSLIRKIEKAKRYAREPERVMFSRFEVDFKGENSSHYIIYDNGNWHCNCHFFSQAKTCSHIMALQQLLNKMLPAEAQSEPVADFTG